MSAYTTGTRRGSAASIGSISTKGRGHQLNKGKLCAGSPGEEMALVEHLKGVSLVVMLWKEDIAKKLQIACENFQLSQVAAVKLAEGSMLTNSVDECVYSLEHYIHKVRKEVYHLEAFSCI